MKKYFGGIFHKIDFFNNEIMKVRKEINTIEYIKLLIQLENVGNFQ